MLRQHNDGKKKTNALFFKRKIKYRYGYDLFIVAGKEINSAIFVTHYDAEKNLIRHQIFSVEMPT